MRPNKAWKGLIIPAGMGWGCVVDDVVDELAGGLAVPPVAAAAADDTMLDTMLLTIDGMSGAVPAGTPAAAPKPLV